MSEYDIKENKLYEFSYLFADRSECFGDVNLLQIGETCLDIGASMSEHVQFCDEITLFISGTGTSTVGKQIHRCGPGDLHIASKGLVHSIISDRNSSLRFIHFGFEFNETASRRLAGFYNQCGSILLHDYGTVSYMFDRLLDEYASESEFSKR